MGALGVGRIALVVLNFFILLLAIALCIAAVITPAWLVVFLAEFQAEHQHGLWMDCTLGRRHIQGAAESLHCTYKFEYSFYSPDTNESPIKVEEDQHKFHEWHKAVITLFAIAVVSGGTALCFTLCAPCVRLCSIVANVLTLLSGFTSGVSVFVFFINSHKTEIRFVHGITLTYEQSKGYSFYLALASVLCFLVAFIVGLLLTICVFLHDRQQHRPSKTFPTNNTSTSISV